MVHGHYGLMGGFAVDISDPSHNFHPEGHDKIILSRDDLLFFAENFPESIPNIPESEIRDKSKANGLAKFLVCIQAFWFCVQCTTRLAQGLSISLLELNTFAHALCTLLIYFLWWDKPLDIEEPTLLRGKKVVQSIAYISSVMTLPHFRIDSKYEIGLYSVTASYSGSSPESSSPELLDQKDQEYAAKFPVKEGYKRVYRGELIHNFSFDSPRNRNFSLRNFFLRNFYARNFSYYSSFVFVDISPAQQLHLQLCKGYYEESRPLSEEGRHKLTDRITDWVFLRETDVDSLLDLGGKTTKMGLQFVIGFWVAGLVYGSLHLTAWNASFNTYAQEVLWKTSALSISLSGFGLALWFAFGRLLRWLDGQMWGWLLSTLMLLYLGIGLLLLVHYIFSRVYLVVECFLSIPHLPTSVYEVPTWSQYFPHIG